MRNWYCYRNGQFVAARDSEESAVAYCECEIAGWRAVGLPDSRIPEYRVGYNPSGTSHHVPLPERFKENDHENKV